jgi:hypothetical protein
MLILTMKVKTTETTYETPWLSVENNDLKLAWIGIDVDHRLNVANFDNGRLNNKKTVKGPCTEVRAKVKHVIEVS